MRLNVELMLPNDVAQGAEHIESTQTLATMISEYAQYLISIVTLISPSPPYVCLAQW